MLGPWGWFVVGFAGMDGRVESKGSWGDSLFDEALIRRFEVVRLLSRRLVRGRMRGGRRSFSRGMSVEFSGYRPFVNGDDWRALDWHAYARWRQLILKLFVEEEDLHIHLLLDCSRSMDWGQPRKFDLARRVLGGLAYISLANLDRVGFIPLGLSLEKHCPPHRGRDQFPALLRALTHCHADAPAGSLSDSVNVWLKTQPRRGLVIVVSDFFGTSLEDAPLVLQRLRHAGQEVGALQVVADEELLPPDPGEQIFEDCETGMTRRVAVDLKSAEAFRERVRSFLESTERVARQWECAFLRVNNHTPPEQVLASILSWE